jgi:hypothetical protein
MPEPASRQAQAFTPDGKPIASAELPKALQSGQANFDANAEVHVRDQTGRAGTVKGSDVAQLLASGGSLETDETLAAASAKSAERQKRRDTALRALNPLQAYVGYYEAINRGASLGLSDLASTALLGDEYRQGAEERAANPLTIIPELGGAAGGALAAEALSGGGATPGVLGAIAKTGLAPWRAATAVGRAGESLLGGAARALGAPAGVVRAAGVVGEGAGAGAVYGVGEEISRASLQNKELTAEKLIAAAGHGALVGGVSTAVLGGLALVGKGVGRGVLNSIVEDGDIPRAVERFGQKNALKALTGDAKRFMAEAGSEERALSIGQKVLDSGVDLKNLSKAGKDLDARMAEAETGLRGVAQALDGIGVKPDMPGLVTALKEQVAKLKEVPLGDFRSVAAAVERQTKPLVRAVEKGREFSFTDLTGLREKLARTSDTALQRANPASVEARKTLSLFDEALENTVSSVGSEPLSQKWAAHLADRSDFGLVKNAVTDALERKGANSGPQASDLMAGGAAFLHAISTGGASLIGLAQAAAVAKRNQLIREKSPAVLARIADRIAKLDRRTDATIHAMIEGKPGLLPAWHRKGAKLATEETHRVTTGKVLEHGTDETVGYAAEGRRGRGAGTAAVAAEPRVKGAELQRQYSGTVSSVLALTSSPPNPEALKKLGGATAPVADQFPELAAAINQRIVQNAQFLRSKMAPPLQRTASITPGIEESRVPAVEAERLLRYRDGIESYEGTLRELAHGQYPREKIEAMRFAFPEAYADTQRRIMIAVSDRTNKIPFKQRMILGLAFELPTDPALTPAGLSDIQSTFAGSAGGSPAPSSPPARPPNPKVSRSYQLASERSLRSD